MQVMYVIVASLSAQRLKKIQIIFNIINIINYYQKHQNIINKEQQKHEIINLNSTNPKKSEKYINCNKYCVF
jgi:hypothetical protein